MKAILTIALGLLNLVIAIASHVEVRNGSFIAKRDFTGGVLLPIKVFDSGFGVELTNSNFASTVNSVPRVLNMKLSSDCKSSSYYTENTVNFLSVLVSLMVTPIVQGRSLFFSGELRPVSRIASKTGILCVKSINIPRDPFNSLMSRFPLKVVSFWFGSPLSNQIVRRATIGEIGFGTMNERRMGVGLRSKFLLKSLISHQPVNHPNILPPGWITRNTVQMQAAGFAIPYGTCRAVFSLGIDNLLVPPTVYKVISKYLKRSIRNAMLHQALPIDVLSKVHEFADEPVTKLDCGEYENLPDLQLDDLHIPKRMLFLKISDDKCQLLVSPHETGGDECLFIVGNLFISKFHFLVDYTSPEGEYAQFSIRRDANAENDETQMEDVPTSCLGKAFKGKSGCTIS